VQQTLSVPGFGTIGSNGQLVVNPLLAAPATITVLSTGAGSNTKQVSTGTVTGGTNSLPVAVNDTATVFEDCSATPSSTACTTPISINVLANDSGSSGGTVALSGAPVLGNASVNADGSIAYTPALNANGTDTFTYNVTVNGQTSNDATVTVNITPVNDAPTAVDDNTGALAGVQNSINVLANDVDPDGPADLASAVIVNGNAALAIISGTVFKGGVVTFTPPAQNPAGNYTFTYSAIDQSGAVSANAATVTVTLSSGEAIVPAKTQYTQTKGRWTLTGIVSPAAGQTISMSYLDGTYKVNGACTGNAAGTVVGTAPTDARGNFTVDQILTSTSGVLNPSNTLGNSTGFWCSPPRNIRYSSSLSHATTDQAIAFK
jgi:VCBS repeat-containing protein